MTTPNGSRSDQWMMFIRQWQERHAIILMRIGIGIMAVAAVIWLSYQFWRLIVPDPPIWPTSPRGAADLMQRFREVNHWFARPESRTYHTIGTAVYPPASYVMLWPFVGWLDALPTRWLWTVTTVAMLAWLTKIFVQECRAQTRLEQAFLAMIPLSIYPTGATIGNGQLNIHVVPLLLVSILMLVREPPSWRRDLIGSCMFLLALVKPTVAGPFFWIILFVRGSWRPALLICVSYSALTYWAISFKNFSIEVMLSAWLDRATGGVIHGAISGAVANQSTWLMSLGMKAWLIPGALIALALAGVWMFIHRRVDPWITMGVIGILFRFSIYHRWYDDLLILPALVALYRIAKQGMATGNRDVLAGLLFIFMLIMMMAPGGLYLLPPPWNGYVTQIQVVVWTGTLLFLLHQAWQEREPAIRAVSVDAIEAANGLNLFASQPDNLEDRLEGTASLQEWPAVFSRGGPRSGSGSSAPRSVPVNVNTASQSQLESLPGIGPVIARRIITGRPWCRVKALTDVKGIGKKRLAGIRGLATVL